MLKQLYVLHLSGTVDTLHLFYSEGLEEALAQAEGLRKDHGGTIVSLKCWPNGFKLVTLEVQGTIIVPDD